MALSGGTEAVVSWMVMGGGGSTTLVRQFGVMASVVGVTVALGRIERLITPSFEM